MEDCKMSISIIDADTDNQGTNQMPNIVYRDKQMNQLQDIINKKRHYIVQKKREIKQKKDLNHLLVSVEKDYEKYVNHIKDEKMKQIQSFDLIKQYLTLLSQNEKMVKQQNLLLQRDQNQIIDEINSLSKELNTLIIDK